MALELTLRSSGDLKLYFHSLCLPSIARDDSNEVLKNIEYKVLFDDSSMLR